MSIRAQTLKTFTKSEFLGFKVFQGPPGAHWEPSGPWGPIGPVGPVGSMAPMGPMRLEWAYVIDPEPYEDNSNWEFSVGGAF